MAKEKEIKLAKVLQDMSYSLNHIEDIMADDREILITPWLILLFVFSIFILFSQILVLFIGNLIFIYEEIKGKNYG